MPCSLSFRPGQLAAQKEEPMPCRQHLPATEYPVPTGLSTKITPKSLVHDTYMHTTVLT